MIFLGLAGKAESLECPADANKRVQLSRHMRARSEAVAGEQLGAAERATYANLRTAVLPDLRHFDAATSGRTTTTGPSPQRSCRQSWGWPPARKTNPFVGCLAELRLA
jgi:hypothetical protein